MDVAQWIENWIMMVSDGIQWYCMVFNGILLLNSIHWYCMVYDGIAGLYLMVFNNIRFPKISP